MSVNCITGCTQNEANPDRPLNFMLHTAQLQLHVPPATTRLACPARYPLNGSHWPFHSPLTRAASSRQTPRYRQIRKAAAHLSAPLRRSSRDRFYPIRFSRTRACWSRRPLASRSRREAPPGRLRGPRAWRFSGWRDGYWIA